jgi:hypothetical protein
LTFTQERVGNTLEAVGIVKDFLNRTQSAQKLRERIDKWDYMKLKSFCTTNEMTCKLKAPLQSGRKSLLAIHQTRD